MIETFSDLARLLDDGWRITGISADSDGDRQRFRFEVEAVKDERTREEFHAWLQKAWEERLAKALAGEHPPAITPEGWEIGSGFAEFLHGVGHGPLDGDE